MSQERNQMTGPNNPSTAIDFYTRGITMQFIKSFTIIASLALALSACSGNPNATNGNVQLDVVGAITQSDALTNCNSFWGWVTNTGCNGDTETQQKRCEELSPAPGYAVGAEGTWDDKKRACVDRWPSPICYGLLMNSCSETGTDATHQCSGWNVACRVMCGKWDGMRFGGYCSADWWEANP